MLLLAKDYTIPRRVRQAFCVLIFAFCIGRFYLWRALCYTLMQYIRKGVGMAMRISELLKKDGVTFSLEVFPPKTSEKYAQTAEAARKIAELKPDFMSVTYGAGGGTGTFTAGIAAGIQREFGVPTLAHLTCVSSDRQHVLNMLKVYRENGIENILALRGDLPKDGVLSSDYRYAVELIRDIRANGDFCIGGACYPEGHIECAHKKDDLDHLAEKAAAGLDFLTTQMFFNNDIFYNFLYRARERGITIPIIAGIMPITSPRQLERSVAMSGTLVPSRFRAIVDHFGDSPEAMKQAGIIYATEQIVDLIANGVRHVHVYTMNKPEVAAGIKRNLTGIL